MTNVELLTLSEAAVVANVDVRDVHRMIDEDILPKELVEVNDGRRVDARACVFVSFYFRGAATLTAEARTHVIKSLWSSRCRDRPREFKLAFVTVNFDDLLSEAIERRRKLEEARAVVECDEEVLGGEPVFKGTRVPVRDVAASVKKGLSKDRILSAYPALKAHMLELAVIWADANPARGRPKGSRRRS
jgi:uncharacterized protein (DUF433 family)